jgi:wee1-like protein kinase
LNYHRLDVISIYIPPHYLIVPQVYALAALSDQADTANFHIVRYHQAWMEDDRLFIQTELCVGTLSDEIDKGCLVLEKRRFKLLREMLLALDFIHRNNMVHLDIKPDNIFIKNDQYKLGDFGLVTKLSSSQEVEEGDSRYMSMEMLSGDKSDLRKSDIFSLGATLYEVCLGRNLPMNGQEWTDIRNDKLSSLPNTSDDMVHIIREMMGPIPASRPTPFELLQRRQLLSEEQKALFAAKTKVAQANMQLVAQEERFQKRLGQVPVARRGLTRANTWNGTTMPYL